MNRFLNHLQADLNSLLIDIDRITGDLSAEEYVKMPGSKSWSIFSIVGHLTRAGQEYLPLLHEASSSAPKLEHGVIVPYRPTWMGRLFVTYLSPESKRKLRAPKLFQPRPPTEGGDGVDELKAQFTTLIELVGDLHDRDFNQVKFSSPVTSLVRFSLADGLMVVIQHARRHMQQIERAKSTIRRADSESA